MTLTTQQLAEFGDHLAARESILNEDIRRVRGNREDLTQAAGEVPDPADLATADVLTSINQAEVSRDVGELNEIAAARTRLADGSYGLCIDCGTDIPVERLRVQPIAQRCIPCQTLREKTYAQDAGV